MTKYSEMKGANVRDSNVELLRILCMLMVLMHHFLIAGPGIAGFKDAPICSSSLIASFINPFLYCAVNTFVLISGFYGIKFKIKGITNLYVRCAWYGSLFYLIYLLATHGHPGTYGLTHNCIFVLSNNRWFVTSYVCLYLIAPILNKLIEALDRSKFTVLIAVLAVLNVYFGWIWGNSVNYSGYNLSQFVFLYFIGRYVATFYPPVKEKRTKYLLVYLLCALAIGSVNILVAGKSEYIEGLFSARYNNPILIIEAIALLYLFKTFSFHSRFINAAAVSVFSVYLIHQNIYVEKFITDTLSKNITSWDSPKCWLLLILSGIAAFIACFVLDAIFKPIYSVLANLLTNLITKIKNIIYDKLVPVR